MNAAPKKKSDEAEAPPAPHPLLATPIAHAYALVPDPEQPGRWFAVHLSGVMAHELEVLEPSARTEPAAYGLERIKRAMHKRHVEKKWGI